MVPYAQVRQAGFPAPKTLLQDIDLPRIANIIGCHEDVVHAVMEVESGKSGADKKGRIKILFEPHVFYRCLSAAKRAEAQKVMVNIDGKSWAICYPSWAKGYPSDSYPRLEAAMAIDEAAAIKACSWGRSQILGENHKLAGYATPFDMVASFADTEANHIEAMIRFMKGVKLDDDLRRIEEIAKTRMPTAADWAPVASGYNGKGYASHNYHGQLAAAFAKWSKIADTQWNPAEALKKSAAPDTKDAKDAGSVVVAAPVVGAGIWAYFSNWSLWQWAGSAALFVVIFGLLYWFLLRPFLRRWSALAPLFETLDAKEAGVFDRVRLAAKGIKSILFGRLIALSGPLLGLLGYMDYIDMSQWLPDILIGSGEAAKAIPASLYVPAFLTPTLGWISNKLAQTRDTTPEQLAGELVKPADPSPSDITYSDPDTMGLQHYEMQKVAVTVGGIDRSPSPWDRQARVKKATKKVRASLTQTKAKAKAKKKKAA